MGTAATDTADRSAGEIAAAQLRRLFARLFEHLDAALFDLATQAEHNAAQIRCFDDLHQLRKCRPAIEQACENQLACGFHSLAGTAHDAPAAGREGEEEALAVAGMVGRHEQRLALELAVLRQRLPRTADAKSPDPLGPAALALSFCQAMGGIDVDPRVRLAVYKLFDRYVLAALDELYRATSAALAEARPFPVPIVSAP